MKKIGFWGALALVVGNIIGVGIFTTTGFMAHYIQSPLWMLSAWLVGAIYAISGAFVYSVLSAKYPLSGGDYQYLSKALHPFFGYLFGWSAFFVTYSGSIAALSIAAIYYIGGIVPGSNINAIIFTIPLSNGWLFELTVTKVAAITILVIFSVINYRGIILAGKSQIVLTAGIFALLIIFALIGSLSDTANYDLLFSKNTDSQSVSGYLAALIAVLFAYMGWTTVVYVSEEVAGAKRILPKALISGVIGVAIIYLWLNILYLSVIPLGEMIDVVNIGSLVANRLWDKSGHVVISGLILIAILSSLNSTILSGPRIYMAMGRDGFFASLPAKIHPRYQVPHLAIVGQVVWSCILVISGSFNALLSYVVFVAIIFSVAAAGISLTIIWKNKPVKWHIFALATFYLLFCIIILVNTLIQRPIEALSGLAILVVAIPFYLMEVKNKRHTSNHDATPNE